jgi:hypothetical protein
MALAETVNHQAEEVKHANFAIGRDATEWTRFSLRLIPGFRLL